MKERRDDGGAAKRSRGAASGRPIMALLDLLGRRWALRILWELRDTPLGFTELQVRCDTMSPSVLNQRLRELRDGGIIELRDGRYAWSAIGRRLHAPLLALNEWAGEWARGQRRQPRGTLRAAPVRASRRASE